MELNSPIKDNFRLGDMQKAALKRLGLETLQDLLFYFPSRYGDLSQVKKISELKVGELATIYGKVTSAKTKKGFRSKIPMGEATVEDLSGPAVAKGYGGRSKIKVVWFHQAYMAKMIHVGQTVKLTGRVAESKSGIYLANPEFEKSPTLPVDLHDSLFSQGLPLTESLIFPIYPETRGITSKWLYHAIKKILTTLDPHPSSSLIRGRSKERVEDYVPEEILKKYHLPALRTALIWIHFPKKKEDAEAARKRFAFEEVFLIQLERAHDRMEYEKNKSFEIKIEAGEVEKFLSRFPFKPTSAQTKAIGTITADLIKNRPMSRLLEGDVGSGKTLVAALAAYATINNHLRLSAFDPRLSASNLQVAYMAPTEILANQHFESFISYFRHLPINIGLITSSGCKKFPSKSSQKFGDAAQSEALLARRSLGEAGAKDWTTISRPQLLKWVQNGEIPILLGTHSLIQKSVKFKHLALVIVDEQHRFGTSQRMKLAKKESFAPHYLSMTATPIPRTLALTIYGDLDLTLLDEMPPGRKLVITEIVPPNKREETYEEIRIELKNGRQMYVICPRIDEPDPDKELVLNAKSVTEEAKRLKKIFPKYETGIVHSKLSKDKKEKVMKEFLENKIQILCATSVVEVGVNVPNATVIIIEGAERFGLAQLHQLRGRVLRSTHQAYCYIFAEAKSDKTMDRLKALKTAKNGFELSELDLMLRGAGELSGAKQWGISDLGMEAIKNIKMVEAARTEAQALIKTDPELDHHPLLKKMVKLKVGEFHFE